MHTPVLLHEALEGLSVKPNGVYIDATVGEGGHLDEIAKHAKKVLAIEVNKEQLERTKEKVHEKNIIFEQANFTEMRNTAQKHGIAEVDGVLFDLGLSFWELTHLRKGLSYKNEEEPLDMRLRDDGETAAEVLNTYTKEDLYGVFATNSEEKRSEKLAEVIVETRQHKKFSVVSDLTELVDQIVGYKDEGTRARVFQALRMHVNQEKKNLKKGLEEALKLLKENGRLVVIAFHSIEDRIVKNFMKTNNMKIITKRTSRFGDQKFERSAILRTAEKGV